MQILLSVCIYIYINELTRNEIASLILGVLNAETCRAKYKRKLLLVIISLLLLLLVIISFFYICIYLYKFLNLI